MMLSQSTSWAEYYRLLNKAWVYGRPSPMQPSYNVMQAFSCDVEALGKKKQTQELVVSLEIALMSSPVIPDSQTQILVLIFSYIRIGVIQLWEHNGNIIYGIEKNGRQFMEAKKLKKPHKSQLQQLSLSCS